MPPSHALIYGFIAGFLAVDIPSGPLVSLNQMVSFRPTGRPGRSIPSRRSVCRRCYPRHSGAECGVWR